jgi:hypothetical protein
MGHVLLAIIAFTLIGCTHSTRHSAADAAIEPQGAVPALRTQDFESGAKRVTEVDSESLEVFLQDLNRRKDWDYASHNGHPGPDSAYLYAWVTQVTQELLNRGYSVDADGQLRRPGIILHVR